MVGHGAEDSYDDVGPGFHTRVPHTIRSSCSSRLLLQMGRRDERDKQDGKRQTTCGSGAPAPARRASKQCHTRLSVTRVCHSWREGDTLQVSWASGRRALLARPWDGGGINAASPGRHRGRTGDMPAPKKRSQKRREVRQPPLSATFLSVADECQGLLETGDIRMSPHPPDGCVTSSLQSVAKTWS